jgi:hypothetical protein
MENAICWKCFDDNYLKEIVERDGEELECSVCGEERPSFTIDQIGELLEPILREHIRLGKEIRVCGENDRDYWETQGDPLSFWVQEVVGECHGLEDDIVDAVVDAENVDPRHGDIPFFDATCDYVESPVSLHGYYAEWNLVVQELKYRRRFFSSSAKALFDRLFDGVEKMQAWNDKGKSHESVVRELAIGSELFRARNCDSHAVLTDILTDPFKHVGPPPASKARAGRMNADGVAVFYGATDLDTSLAEMRPPLGGDSAVITLRTTKQLRMLDFKRLQSAYGGEPLSYFQSDFTEQVEKNAFRRRLHKLISQPVTPGREADYLITQTMAEYLAHIHLQPFDGVLFASVQRAEGTNVVLFPDHGVTDDPDTNSFPVEYVDGSIKVFSTEMVEYRHKERHVYLADGKVSMNYDPDDFPDDE